MRLKWTGPSPQEDLVKVSIYVSRDGPYRQRPGIALVRHPLQLPLNNTWTYLRVADTSEFSLPEAIEEEIEHRGIWAQRVESSEIVRKL